MKVSYNKGSRILGLAIVAGLLGIACSSDNTNNGGTAATGGSTAAVGGSTATGGKSGTGGTSNAPTGGKSSTGGSSAAATTAVGGTTTAGGSSAVGGTTTAGGSSTVGGTTTAGGSSAVGGTTTAGGSSAVGGTTTAGGSSEVGGTTTAGGSSAVGGSTTEGGTTANGGTTSTSTSCPVVFDWEGSDVQGWSADTGVTLAQDTAQAVTGTHSLKVTLPALTSYANADAGATYQLKSIGVGTTEAMKLYPGATVTFNIWAPSSETGLWVQTFSQSNNWNKWDAASKVTLTPGAWKSVTYTVPNTLPGGIQKLGIQLGVEGGASIAADTAVYVDSVTICGGNTACAVGTAQTGAINFDTAGSVEGFSLGGNPVPTDVAITQSTDQFYGASGGSLKFSLTAIPASTSSQTTSRLVQFGGQSNASTFTFQCGQTVTFHVYTDGATAAGVTIQPFSSQNNWGFSAGAAATLVDKGWTTVTYTIPTTVNSLGLQAVGIQVNNTSTTATYTGTVYVDAITW